MYCLMSHIYTCAFLQNFCSVWCLHLCRFLQLICLCDSNTLPTGENKFHWYRNRGIWISTCFNVQSYLPKKSDTVFHYRAACPNFCIKFLSFPQVGIWVFDGTGKWRQDQVCQRKTTQQSLYLQHYWIILVMWVNRCWCDLQAQINWMY